MRRALPKLLLCLALLVPAGAVTVANEVRTATPAAAHYDHWHNATCQGTTWLMYNWPSAYGGTRVMYWTGRTGEMRLDNPELTIYAQQGYECGWMGAMLTHPWIQEVCEFGYCGTGMIHAFANGWMARHFGGPYAGYVAVYNR